MKHKSVQFFQIRKLEAFRKLAESPELNSDIFAITKRRNALKRFKQLIDNDTTEAEWQSFFELNTWVFGHGLNYTFLEKASKKLEATTTGASYAESGKRTDGLMRTRAEISQFVLIESKRHSTPLLKTQAYRSGCFPASDELSGAVTQIQKTVFEFSRNRLSEYMKDEQGNRLPDLTYSVQPKSYIVIGSLSSIKNNDDKVISFELYRKNIHNPEIITFDELFLRAKCIIEYIDDEMGNITPSDNPSHR